MVNYNCQRCGYETINKTMFKRHLLRKNLCISKLDKIDRYQLLVKNDFDEEAKKYEKNTNSPPNNSKNPPKKVEYVCKYCDRNFTRSDALKRHIDSRCKNKQKITDQIEQLMEMVIIMKEEMIEKDKQINNLKKKLSKQDEKLNLNNGTVNIANRDINTTNNILINNYGSENIDYITDKVFKKLLAKPMSAITRLIELKHFHPKHPENHNVKITNIHDKYAKIYQDKKWLIKHKKDVVEDLVENGYADFEEFKDLNEDELAEKIKEKYLLLQKNYQDNFEKICRKSELSIINETKNIDV